MGDKENNFNERIEEVELFKKRRKSKEAMPGKLVLSSLGSRLLGLAGFKCPGCNKPKQECKCVDKLSSVEIGTDYIVSKPRQIKK